MLVCCAATAAGQEAQYFEEQKPRAVFQWDFLARWDRITHLNRSDIIRGRFEARPELDFVVSDRFRIGARAVADLGTDQNSDNARNFDNYRTTGATLERYFLEAKPGPFALRAGSFGMPLLASEMLWDRDIQALGAAAACELPAGGSRFTLAVGGFRGPQRDGDRTRVGAGQIVWRSGDPGTFAVEAAGSYWHFDPRALKLPLYIRQNYSRSGEFVSRFRIVDALVRFRFPVGRLPVAVSLDGLTNLGVRDEAEGDGDAFEGSVTVGSVGTPGDVRGFYTYQYVERDAMIGAYTTDDWWFHTWHRGHRFGVSVTVFPQVFVQGTAVFQKRLDRETYIDRFTLDLVKMF